MSAHAFLPPSSAPRWGVCPLSASLEAAYPESEDSPQSLEGTAAHWVVQMLLQGTPAALGQQAPNGIAVSQEMVDGAELVLEEITRVLGPNFRQFLVIETRVYMPRVHPTQNWGTPDYRAWIRLSDGRLKLYLWDYKFGFGIVDAIGNLQFVDYVEGCFQEANIDGLQDQSVEVEMVVIQPRAPHREGPVRRWPVRGSDLRPYVNQLANAAGEACGPNPRANPTPEACENCNGRHACEALQRKVFTMADKGMRYGALDLTPLALGLELRVLEQAQELIKARITGLQAQAMGSLRNGVDVPFWMLDSIPGRLAWNKPAEEVFAFGDMLGLDLRKDPEPITPTQAKDAAKRKGIPAEVLASFSERPAGAVKLVYDDGAKMRLIFSKM